MGIATLIIVLSVVANLLLLTGPIFMLQVYDRVLTSGSAPTLLVLLGLVGLLYLLYSVFEFCRSRLLARLGAAIALTGPPGDHAGEQALARRRQAQFIGSAGALALLDLPWSPIFFAALFAFHPWIGATALAGAGVLVLIGVAQHIMSAAGRGRAMHSVEDLKRLDATTIRARAGMPGGHVPDRLASDQGRRVQGLILQDLHLGDLGAGFVAGTRGFRLFLQSFVLAVGAWLVLDGQLSGGQMIAGSILLGRALAPLEATLANWPALMRARTDRAVLRESRGHADDRPTPLPVPSGPLRADHLTIIPAGHRTAAFRDATLTATQGSVTGICGPNGSGKSLLLGALAVRVPVHGRVTLGGCALSQYGADIPRHVGWLPQDSRLFPGTIAQNITARVPDADAQHIHDAARDAGALDVINSLPMGMDTCLWPNGPDREPVGVSAGCARKIALARAICGNPALVLLDEPDALLDTSGLATLIRQLDKLRARGTIVVLATHNAAVLRACDQRLLIEAGRLVPVRPAEGTSPPRLTPMVVPARGAQS